MKNEAIIQLFIENAAKVAANPIKVANTKEMNSELAKIIENDGNIFLRKKTYCEKAVRLPKERIVSDYLDAAFTIEQVDGAIAETGSIICSSLNGRAVQSSVLPIHHIAIVKADTIYETLDDFFGNFPEAPPTNITLITGPSRTADIELTLTIGIHGPEKLSIIVL